MTVVQTIPILLHCDVEPDDRVVDPHAPCGWFGFEGLIELMPRLRARIESATDRPARWSWFVRMDPQVAQVYGSADWVAARYGAALDSLAAAGDQIGSHVHPWQWQNDTSSWSQNFADQEWVTHCVEFSLSAFEQSFGYPCEAFRFGDHWMNDATIDLLERRGIVCDLTIEPGLAGTSAPDAYTGTFPDYSNALRLPFRPARGDFISAQQPTHSDVTESDRSLCCIPLSSGPSEWASSRSALDASPEPAPNGFLSDSPLYEGHHDTATTCAIEGWVWDLNNPERRLDVDVFCDDELLATVGATAYRPDLEASGKGDGTYAFYLPTPTRFNDGGQHRVRVRVSGADVDLIDTPKPLLDGHSFGINTLHLDLLPMVFASMVDRLLTSLSQPFLNMPIRSDAGSDPLRRAAIIRNLDYLLSHRLSDRFAFMTPGDFVDSWPGLANRSAQACSVAI